MHKTTASPPDLSVAQYAEARGVSPVTVRRWVAMGYISAYRLGPKLIRIPADELTAGTAIPSVDSF